MKFVESSFVIDRLYCIFNFKPFGRVFFDMLYVDRGTDRWPNGQRDQMINIGATTLYNYERILMLILMQFILSVNHVC